MTLAQLVNKSYLLATGKATSPSSTSNKYTKILGFANICQDAWQNEPDTDWSSLYVVTTLAATVTATDTFALSASIREISNREGDSIQIVRLDGGVNSYKLVRPNELQDYSTQRVVARIGSNLKFSIPFTATDPEIGGSIKVPNYGFVSTLASDEDIIQVENPLWLAYAVAAEYCRTDQVLAYRESGLLERANEVMRDMKQANEGNSPAPIKKVAFSTFGRSW